MELILSESQRRRLLVLPNWNLKHFLYYRDSDRSLRVSEGLFSLNATAICQWPNKRSLVFPLANRLYRGNAGLPTEFNDLTCAEDMIWLVQNHDIETLRTYPALFISLRILHNQIQLKLFMGIHTRAHDMNVVLIVSLWLSYPGQLRLPVISILTSKCSILSLS